MLKPQFQFDLSILIPARNEAFLARTIENILENIRGNTEIIVVLDGNWPDPPIADNERVTLIYHSKPIGQRAATNEAARLSKAKYVMKMDAHCAVGEGFDVILMEDMQSDWTVVPKMYNLHAFNWLCPNGHRRYQGPSGECEDCGEPTEREMIWKPRGYQNKKPSPESTSMYFDKDLRFGYWGNYKKHQRGDHVETMSLLGACWMLERERYHELNILDEKHGSWGQMGTEIACKTWLSGGKLICNKRTWFAHMFRTQGGDFGFPYNIRGHEVNKAREYSRNLFLSDGWDKAIYPLSWLIDKFTIDGKRPPTWEDINLSTVDKKESRELTKGIVYYTDNRLNKIIAGAAQNQLKKAANGIPIVSASLEPMPDFGQNIYIPLERGILTMFKQILAGLEELDTDLVFFAEHDMLYHPSHFDFVPPEADKYWYNTNVWKVRFDDGHAMRTDFCQQTSGLCAYREFLITHYKKRIAIVEDIGFSRKMGFEPGTHGRGERVDDFKSGSWESEYPNIDIRHGFNLTPSRWSPDQFRSKRYTKGWTEAEELPGWGLVKGRFREMVTELAQ
jgi:glycosyltransferase involved in cell wall biosynthesis